MRTRLGDLGAASQIVLARRELHRIVLGVIFAMASVAGPAARGDEGEGQTAGAASGTRLLLVSSFQCHVSPCDFENSVLRYDAVTGEFLGVHVSGLPGPYGMALRPYHETLLVVSRTNSSVEEYHPFNGAHLGRFISAGSEGLNLPQNIVVNGRRNILLTSLQTSTSLTKVNGILEFHGVTGQFVTTFVNDGSILSEDCFSPPCLRGAGTMALGTNGRLYVVSGVNSFIMEYDGLTGVRQGVFADPGLTGPIGLLIRPPSAARAGNLHVTSTSPDPNDTLDDTILEFDKNTRGVVFTNNGIFASALVRPGPIIWSVEQNVLVPEGTGTFFPYSDRIVERDGGSGAPMGLFTQSGDPYIHLSTALFHLNRDFAPYDQDGDGDIDMRDWAGFQRCAGLSSTQCLTPFDDNLNAEIGLADYAGFRAKFRGPRRPCASSAQCADNNPCATDSCVGGFCTGSPVPDGTPCADTLFCDGNEICKSGLCIGARPCVDTAHCDESGDRCLACINNGECNDGRTCTIDTCVNGACQYSNAGSAVSCDDANPCTINDHCSSGVCVGGGSRVCNDNNVCTNDSCNPQYGCLFTDNLNPCNDNNACTFQDFCLQGTCRRGSTVNCEDSNQCTNDSCDPVLGCRNINRTGACEDGNLCTDSDTCQQGVCRGTPRDCNDNVSCTVDICSSGACFHIPDDDLCDNSLACDGTEICHETLGCRAGTPLNCSDGVACTVDTCNEVDGCRHSPNNAACGNGQYCDGVEVCHITAGCQDGPDPCQPPLLCDETQDQCVQCLNDAGCSDSFFCTGAETCVAGACRAGTPVNCADIIPCTIDTCNENFDRCDHFPNNSACNNGQYCDGVETCHVNFGCQDGPDPNCLDDVPCTIDACDEGNDTCTHTANHAACANGSFCDGSEVCDVTLGCQDAADACAPPTKCDEPNDRCVSCLSDPQCDNSIFCDGLETCDEVAGVCVPGTPPACDDGVPCTVDSCNPTTDSCEHAPDNGACANGAFCDGSEVCHVTLGCQDGTPPNCNDGVSCTVDNCDEGQDRCDHTPNDTLCTNGAFCDGFEFCHAVNGCQAGTAPNCGDGVPCTTDSCNEADDRCDHVPNHTVCDNSAFCDGAEVCHPVNNCVAGTAPNCDDGVTCTVDSCNETDDRCDHVPDDSRCGDGEFCNGVETCDPLIDCIAGTSVDCADTVACTVDACDEDNNVCTHAPDHAFCASASFCDGVEFCDVLSGCQDGPDACAPPTKCDEPNDRCVSCLSDPQCDNSIFCDGLETCDEVAGVCVPGTPPACDDGVSCTVDSCNPTTDSCEHAPDNGACANGAFCDGSEVCHATLGCQAGAAPNCDDGVGCTLDSCNEADDRCDHAPDDAICTDGEFCTGVETCHATAGCQSGVAPNCDDGVSCTADSCNETDDDCDHVPDNAICDNGDFCDGIESCDALNDCQDGVPPDCNDGVGCTIDECVEAIDDCSNTPDHAVCQDEFFCNGSEICDESIGCRDGADPCLSPLLCDEADNRCVACFTPADCPDDADECTDPTCTAGVCGTQSNAVACDDGEFCTFDDTRCTGGPCIGTHRPDGTGCNDADACTQTDTCQAGVCTGSDPVVCSPLDECHVAGTCSPATGCSNPFASSTTECDTDGSECTIENCDGAGSCQFVSNVICDAPDPPCEGGEQCDPGTGACLPQSDAPAATECDLDNDQCTVDECNGAGLCVFVEDVVCQDADPPCEGGELCDSITGDCVAEPDASAGTACDADSDVCTDDECDGNGQCVFQGDVCGACCDHSQAGGECSDDVLPEDCTGANQTFHAGEICADVEAANECEEAP